MLTNFKTSSKPKGLGLSQRASFQASANPSGKDGASSTFSQKVRIYQKKAMKRAADQEPRSTKNVREYAQEVTISEYDTQLSVSGLEKSDRSKISACNQHSKRDKAAPSMNFKFIQKIQKAGNEVLHQESPQREKEINVFGCSDSESGEESSNEEDGDLKFKSAIVFPTKSNLAYDTSEHVSNPLSTNFSSNIDVFTPRRQGLSEFNDGQSTHHSSCESLENEPINFDISSKIKPRSEKGK